MALTIFATAIRQLDELFLLNDVHKASGGAEKHSPNRFTRLQQTQELAAEILQTPDLALPLKTVRGVGVFACKEMVISYASWISPKINLAVIRAFLERQKIKVASAVSLLSTVRIVDGLYRLNDVQSLSGYDPKTEPNKFFKSKTAQRLAKQVSAEKQGMAIGIKRKGQHKGTYGCKEVVLAYARWLDVSLYQKIQTEFSPLGIVN